jgi:hypothetical protein
MEFTHNHARAQRSRRGYETDARGFNKVDKVSDPSALFALALSGSGFDFGENGEGMDELIGAFEFVAKER